jgi:hypothetical protein
MGRELVVEGSAGVQARGRAAPGVEVGIGALEGPDDPGAGTLAAHPDLAGQGHRLCPAGVLT